MGSLSHTVSGDIASFRTPSRVPIESLKLHFLPKQEGSGDPSPLNVRPITGWTGCKLFRPSGINQWDEQWEVGAYTSAGIPSSGSDRIRSKNFTPVLPSTEYYLYIGKNMNCRVYFYDKNRTFISSEAYRNTIFETPSNCYFIHFASAVGYGETYSNDISINNPSTDTSYHASEMAIPISWSDHGVEYGGYVDVVSGKLICDKVKIIIDDATDFSYSDRGSVSRFNIAVSNIGPANAGNQFVIFNYLKTDASTTTEWCGWINASNNKLQIFTPSSINSISKFTQYLSEHPLEFSYKIATPIEYDLTPQQLQTFLDYNNFWSDTNDITEVTYAVTESKDIMETRKKIIADVPHIATLSSPAPVFNTDMGIPLKEFKMNFLPIQLGSGTPSVSNVRDIISIGSIDYFKNDKIQIPQLSSNEHYSSATHIFEFSGSYNSNTAFSYDLNDDIIFENGKTYTMVVSVLAGFYTKLFGIALKGDWPVSLVKTTETIGPTYLLGVDFTISGQQDVLRDNKIQVSIGKGSSELRFKIMVVEKTSNVFDDNTLSFVGSYGNVYGGYIDLLSGELIDDVTAYETTWGDGTQAEILGDYERRVFIAETRMFKNAQEQIDGGVYFCNVSGNFSLEINGAQWSTDLPQYVFGNNVMILKLPVNTPSNTQIKFVGKRTDPITHQLTSQQIDALKGLNCFWNNVNGNIDVKYWTH